MREVVYTYSHTTQECSHSCILHRVLETLNVCTLYINAKEGGTK